MKNLKRFVSLMMVFIFASKLQAQMPSTGLDIEREKEQFKQVLKLSFMSGSKGEEIPLVMSLKEYAPPIGNQGKIGSCVGWSSGYGIMTMLNAQKYEWSREQIEADAFSALYVYNNIKIDGCQGGASLYDAGRFLKENGDCRSSEFDQDKQACWKEADESVKSYAKDFKIKDFYAVFDYSDSDKEKVQKMKRVLAEGDPVLVGVMLRANFAKPEGEYWEPESGDVRPWGGHAMTVVGYNDAKRSFELLNSWGPQWGNDGFIRVRYQDFAKHCAGAYRLVLDSKKEADEEEEELVALSGKFDFRTLKSDDWGPLVDSLGNLVWEYPSQINEGKYNYGLKKRDWKKYDKFQVVLTEAQKDSYVYAFSVDANGTNVHWPRQKELNSKFESYGSGEAPIISRKDPKIIIPGKETALQREAEGDDNICILYCSEPIPDFKKRISDFDLSQGDFNGQFETAFGDLLVPTEDINYRSSGMMFKSKTKSGKTVVPLILTVTDR